MKILITGGAGFLGYHLAHRLIKEKHKVILLDIAVFNKSEYPNSIEFEKGDVRNLELLNEIILGTVVVIHAAAALPLWGRREIFSTNVEGTRNILEAALKNGIERVVFISSTAVYGVPKKHPIYEDDPLAGVGAYGESKIEAEKICEEYRKKGVCVSIIRPKTFIGAGRLGVFQILYDWIESGKKIPIIGNAKNKYQLLEVNDLVDVIHLLLTESRDTVNNTFNVGAEKFNTVLEDVGALCEFAGTGSRVLPTPARIVKPLLALFEKMKLSPLYKWVYDTADTNSYVSIKRIKDTFRWSPKYSNAQALINSYKWYLEHKGELSKTGITHRVAWKQGVLNVFKRFS